MTATYAAEIEAPRENIGAGSPELIRRRGAPLLAALPPRLPTAETRAEIAHALAAVIARRLADPSESDLIPEAARLQDVGRIYVRAELAGQAAPALLRGDRAELEAHYEYGAQLARGAGIPERACAWILHARERWDGAGPTGLTGREIPLGARIIAVTREYLDAPSVPGTEGLDPRAAGIFRLDAVSGTVLDPTLARFAVRVLEGKEEDAPPPAA